MSLSVNLQQPDLGQVPFIRNRIESLATDRPRTGRTPMHILDHLAVNRGMLGSCFVGIIEDLDLGAGLAQGEWMDRDSYSGCELRQRGEGDRMRLERMHDRPWAELPHEFGILSCVGADIEHHRCRIPLEKSRQE